MPAISGTETIKSWWDDARSSLWFVPSICVVVAIALSFILPEIDRRWLEAGGEAPAWLFAGSAEGAQDILATISGALITVVALIFSLTIIVLQQASNQYTPRVLGNFMRQRGNQMVLGVFLGTFIYGLLVLRYVRTEDAANGEFIPVLSISVTLLGTLACLGLLVYFIHHTATSLQASSVTSQVHDMLRTDVAHLYPDQIGSPVDSIGMSLDDFRHAFARGTSRTIVARKSGFLRTVDDRALIAAAGLDTRWAMIFPLVGEFVVRGAPLFEFDSSDDVDEEREARLCNAFVLERERSSYSDALFGVRQLADIALKALSPGVNDPTTAEYAISALGDILAELAPRRFPHPVRLVTGGDGDDTHQTYIWINRADYGDFVREACSQIRDAATGNAHVLLHLLAILTDVARNVEPREHAGALGREIDDIERTLEHERLTPRERTELRSSVAEARATLQTALS